MTRRGWKLGGLIAALAITVACAVALAGSQVLGQAFNVGSRIDDSTVAAERLERGLSRLRHRAPRGTTVRLDRFTSFEWDRVYAFEGYSEPAEINAAVGAEVYYGDAT